MAIFLSWILLSALVAMYASNKGRSAGEYFLLALVLSPLIGFLIVLANKPDRETAAKKSGLKKCLRCAEYVQDEAIVCRYCGGKFPRESGGIVLEE